MAVEKISQKRPRSRSGAGQFPDYVPQGVRSRHATIVALPISQADRDRADRLAGLSRGHSMEDAYRLLEKAIRQEAEKLQPPPAEADLDRVLQYYADRFFDAAWCAGMDFSRYRAAVKRAKDLKDKIGVTAAHLAQLLRDFQATGLPAPPGFLHVDALLKQTENSGDLYTQIAWGAFRDNLLRDGYAWSKSPGLDDMMEKLAQISREFEPQEPSEFISAAISSQKRNLKSEYIRAFGNLLQSVHKMEPTPDLMKAMVEAATAAIDEPDVVVSYEDVRDQFRLK